MTATHANARGGQHLSSMQPAKAIETSRSDRGFSLAEVIIAAALMLIATTVTISLFNFSISQDRSARGKQEEQSAISQDVASIESMNDRYNCSSTSGCSISTTDPGENDYYTAGQSAATATGGFDDSCKNGQLIDNLLTSIGSRTKPASFTKLGISTTVTKNALLYVESATASATTANPNSNPRYLRYTVTWTNASGQRLRQLTLVPTAAGWCP